MEINSKFIDFFVTYVLVWYMNMFRFILFFYQLLSKFFFDKDNQYAIYEKDHIDFQRSAIEYLEQLNREPALTYLIKSYHHKKSRMYLNQDFISSKSGIKLQYLSVFQEGYNKGFNDAMILMQSKNQLNDEASTNQPKNIHFSSVSQPYSYKHPQFQFKPQSKQNLYQSYHSSLHKIIKSSSHKNGTHKRSRNSFKKRSETNDIEDTFSIISKPQNPFRDLFQDDENSLQSSNKSPQEPEPEPEPDNYSCLKKILAEKIKQKKKKESSQDGNEDQKIVQQGQTKMVNLKIQETVGSTQKSSRSSNKSDQDDQRWEYYPEVPQKSRKQHEKIHLENNGQGNQGGSLDGRQEEEIFEEMQSGEIENYEDYNQEQLQKQQYFTQGDISLNSPPQVTDNNELQSDLYSENKVQRQRPAPVKRQRKKRLIRRAVRRRPPFSYAQIDQLKLQFEKASLVLKANPKIYKCQTLYPIAQKFGSGRATIEKLFLDWQNDPTLKAHYKKKFPNRSFEEKARNRLRIQAITNVFTENPFLTNEQVAKKAAVILYQTNPNKKRPQLRVSDRIVGDVTRKMGYCKRRYKLISMSRNLPANVELRKTFCEKIQTYLKSQTPVYFLNIDQICIHPYLSKDMAWARIDQNQNQVLNKLFCKNYFNGIFIAGKKFLDWEFTQGLWSEDQYVNTLYELIGRITQHAVKNIPQCEIQQVEPTKQNIVIIVNPKYLPDSSKKYQARIQDRSSVRLNVLEELCKEPKQNTRIIVERMPPFSFQLSLISSIELYLRERHLHKELISNDFELQPKQLNSRLWKMVTQHLQKLIQPECDKLEKMWIKFEEYIQDGIEKHNF